MSDIMMLAIHVISSLPVSQILLIAHLKPVSHSMFDVIPALVSCGTPAIGDRCLNIIIYKSASSSSGSGIWAAVAISSWYCLSTASST